MSTPNFAAWGTPLVYAFKCAGDDQFEEMFNKIREEFITYFEKFEVLEECYCEDMYPGQYVGTMAEEMFVGKVKFTFRMDPVVRAGFYNDANLDFEITYGLNDHFDTDIPSEEYMLEAIKEETNWDDEQCKMKVDEVIKWMQHLSDRYGENAIRIFHNHASRLVCLGVASNGEAWYRMRVNRCGKRRMNPIRM